MSAIARAVGFARNHNRMLILCIGRGGHKMSDYHRGQRDAWIREARKAKSVDQYYVDRLNSGFASLAK